ncbi:MAG TPA: MFS transporter [Anaerolineales bacterium]|nr:MFS transporter [Anaerolineales bacterium]
MSITEKPINLSLPVSKIQADDFQTAEVITVAGAHGAHDTYFSFLPTILPLLIEKFSLSTAQAGFLTAFSQIPNLLQPLIGLLADRKNLKMLVVLAPALSGCLITLMGVAPNYGMVALLLLLAGFSTAGFHAIAPGMVGAHAGRKVGRGMGFFMVGGELGFSIGPLLVVATIGYLTLRGLPWLMVLGMLASFILYFRLRQVSTVRLIENKSSLPVRQVLAELPPLLLPIISTVFITGFLTANVVNYLPTFMAREGAAFSLAGASLSVVEFSATVGVLLMGLVSDRLGHRNVAIIGIIASVVFSAGFLWTQGWLQILMLVGVGLTIFVPNPAFLAILQTRFQYNRSLVNGMYMSSSFILRSLAVVIVGFLADRYGMRSVFAWSAAASLLAVPLMLLLPNRPKETHRSQG